MLPGLAGIGGLCGAAVAVPTVYYRTAEALGPTADFTDANWHDTATLTFTEGELEPNTDYLVVWSIDGQTDGTQAWKCRVTSNGSDVFTTDPTVIPGEISAPVDYLNFGGIFRFQSGASDPVAAREFILQFQGNNVSPCRARNARVSLLKMGANDIWAESIARQTTTSATMVDRLTATFTPPSTGNYIFLVTGLLDLVNASNVQISAELTDGTTTTNERIFRPLASADRTPFALAFRKNLTAVSTTLTFRMRESGSGSTTIGCSELRFIAIREDRFANAYYDTGGASSGTETTYTTGTGTQTFTPAAGDHLTIATWLANNTSSTISTYSQFADGGTSINESIRELNADTFASGFAHRLATYAAASRTQVVQRKAESGTASVTIPNIICLDLNGIS